MRQIAAGLFISLDGVVEAPENWTGPYFNDQVGQAVGALMATNDAMLLGRVTYEGFAAAFGGQSGGMADQMNNTPKYVVSSTLTSADWQNSTLINGDIAAQISALESQLQGTANSQNAQGEFLFAGFSSGSQPFVRGAFQQHPGALTETNGLRQALQTMAAAQPLIAPAPVQHGRRPGQEKPQCRYPGGHVSVAAIDDQPRTAEFQRGQQQQGHRERRFHGEKDTEARRTPEAQQGRRRRSADNEQPR